MECQLSLHTADLLAVTISRNCDRAIHVAKLRRFQQRERRDALARSQLKSVGNERIVFVAANLNFVGIRFAAVDELSLYGLFSDQSI